MGDAIYRASVSPYSLSVFVSLHVNSYFQSSARSLAAAVLLVGPPGDSHAIVKNDFLVRSYLIVPLIGPYAVVKYGSVVRNDRFVYAPF